MLWLMCNCDFLGKGEKDYRTGTRTQREAIFTYTICKLFSMQSHASSPR